MDCQHFFVQLLFGHICKTIFYRSHVLDTSEIHNMRRNLSETMSKNEPGSQLYNSCKEGLYNIDNELRSRGEY